MGMISLGERLPKRVSRRRSGTPLRSIRWGVAHASLHLVGQGIVFAASITPYILLWILAYRIAADWGYASGGPWRWWVRIVAGMIRDVKMW